MLRSNGVEKSAADVQAWIERHGASQNYFDRPFAGNVGQSDWYVSVKAPKLLSDLFQGLSGTSLEYRKMVHSIAITEWLIGNKPAHLTEICEYVRGLVPV